MRFMLLTLWLFACAESDSVSDASAINAQGIGGTADSVKKYDYIMGMQSSCYETKTQDQEGACYRMGMRSYREINATLSRLTGVSSQTGEVRTAFQQVQIMLPRKNSLDGFLGAVPGGIFRLASAYCNQFVNGKNMAEVQRQRFPEIDFNGRATAALASSKRTAVANAFIDAFWGKNLVNGKDRDSAVEHLTAYIDTSLQEEGHSDTVKGTKNTLLGVCTAMLFECTCNFLLMRIGNG